MLKNHLPFLVMIVLGPVAFSQTPRKHEFRGVWIASVANIDWPSRPGLSSADQQKEFLAILDMHKSNRMNAVIVQVRPAADALYPSTLEPWSKWLTGKLGKPPEPYYDPLAFMIDAAHTRGMEFHAWLNPYRAVVNADTAHLDSASVAFQHRHWFVKYDKNLYFNPGLPEAREHVTDVVLDVVNRYAVDGIHFDDYFYPYKVANLAFPDSATFAQYGQGFQDIDDWRRENVNALIRNISDSLRKVKPHVKFGISPFGVWRNRNKGLNGSDTQAGQTCYDDLYADVLKWMKEGWIDYITPQLYWSIGFTAAPYEVLAKWWNENSFGKPIYIGQAAYRVDGNIQDPNWKMHDQLPKQIRMNRNLSNVEGSVFFSSKSFNRNPLGINDSLKNELYKSPALIPPVKKNTRFNTSYPLTFTTKGNTIILRWSEANPLRTLSGHIRYVVYRFEEGEAVDCTSPGNILAVLPDTNPYSTTTQWYHDTTAQSMKKYTYVVTGINCYQVESTPVAAFGVKNYKKFWRVYPPMNL